MSNTSRTWLGILIAIIVVLVVIWTMPVYPVKPGAMFLPADGVKPAYTGAVALYNTRTAPFSSKTLGVINLRYHTDSFSEQNQRIVFDALKKIAANNGGNGVVVDEQRTGLTQPSPAALQVIVATATVVQTRDTPSN